MKNKLDKQMVPIQKLVGQHILYCYKDSHFYIENAVSFILTGIKQGDYVVVIENDRLFRLIDEKVKTQLRKGQLNQINYVNNFDFYFSNGDFHTPTIISSFATILDSVYAKRKSIRTWAHVEWGNLQEITCKIIDFEVAANQTVHSMNTTSVCAYDVDRLSEPLKESLMRSHPYQLTDDGVICSTDHQKFFK
ncbi:MEDS domain-containing protein [Mesobacillus maritimus]|uniref:MEDS domain-containing protein n=1 Tax=Mesobacillus maritimus TaxID=1643336 RepID=UPI00384FB740